MLDTLAATGSKRALRKIILRKREKNAFRLLDATKRDGENFS
jgi:hypothetical protein